METFSISSGQDRCRVELVVTVTGQGISVLLTGGDEPHVGGVILSVPRASLTGNGIGCDTWIVPAPGHKDIQAGVLVAEVICRKTGQTVAVTAGIHSDHMEQAEITAVQEYCLEAARTAADKCQNLAVRCCEVK